MNKIFHNDEEFNTSQKCNDYKYICAMDWMFMFPDSQFRT